MARRLKTPRRDGTTHLVMSPLEFMQRLAALIQPTATAPANDRYGAVNLGCRTPDLGRVRPTDPLNSLPETCRSSWAAIQLTFV